MVASFNKIILLFLIGTVQSASASNLSQFFSGGSKSPRKQVFTSSGTWTHPSPGASLRVKVTVIGAGGAGWNNSCTAGAGGASSFGALLSATGGTGGSTTTLDTKPVAGKGANNGACVMYAFPTNANDYVTSAPGGMSVRGYARGGDSFRNYTGATTTVRMNICGGGSGNLSEGDFLVSANQTVTVGAKGTCSGIPVDSEGGSGAVIVEWLE